MAFRMVTPGVAWVRRCTLLFPILTFPLFFPMAPFLKVLPTHVFIEGRLRPPTPLQPEGLELSGQTVRYPHTVLDYGEDTAVGPVHQP